MVPEPGQTVDEGVVARPPVQLTEFLAFAVQVLGFAEDGARVPSHQDRHEHGHSNEDRDRGLRA